MAFHGDELITKTIVLINLIVDVGGAEERGGKGRIII